jgi:hypothetical protein
MLLIEVWNVPIEWSRPFSARTAAFCAIGLPSRCVAVEKEPKRMAGMAPDVRQRLYAMLSEAALTLRDTAQKRRFDRIHPPESRAG